MESMISSPTAALVVTLFICALAIPYLLPRIGAAIGIVVTGYGAWILASLRTDVLLLDIDRSIGTLAVVYGLIWVALGVARHVLRKALVEPA